MSKRNSYEKRRKHPFTRKHYKETENIMVNGTRNTAIPITREEAKKCVNVEKRNHRYWFKYHKGF